MKKNIVLSICILSMGILVGCNLQNDHNASSAPEVMDRIDPPVQIDAWHKEIVVDTPQAHDMIASPLMVTGMARGWFFEGSFPIELVDEQNMVLAQGFVTAQSDWMTDEMVAFSGELIFDSGLAERGILILRKDNPSDQRELDASVGIPVRFK